MAVVGGFYRKKSGIADDLCSYVRPVAGEYSIELTVSSRADAASPQPCEFLSNC